MVTIAGISLKAGRILQKLDSVINDAEEIQNELKDYSERITALEAKLDTFNL